ncbi:hypothetical protein A3A39_00490 [Candidatus Kaiserbacteria bacterium RIFCSPLOWO2_01_FULL_54_13]|uniref:PilN domain-containing protein n=1 Tax=Candidatus Kaiserbacteria bacterium RIFCSPLOWO2_01_FULL_54_13 TaxID=1798512 RepID=A0A1F6F0N2_9BACT|nr:MAG: hypothetical protein A3A39_00490 [Candidatus Kaiserbacteria bacterium RIFCSPLOWO2_01_FULL_54_13]
MPNTSAPQSFIPHEVPIAATAARPKGRGIGDLFVLLAVVLFVASAALAVGLLLYGEYLQSSAASKVDQLERAKAAFEPTLIQELTRLGDRMRSASEILGRHIAPSALFSMLEQTTIATIAFSTLSFNAAEPQHISLEMDGVAGSVNAIALQADLFSRGGMVTSPIFSDIDRETDGVHFSVSAFLNPEAVNFSRLVTTAVAAGAAESEANTTPFGGGVPLGNPVSPQGAAPPQ